jgi:hypothetical protein
MVSGVRQSEAGPGEAAEGEYPAEAGCRGSDLEQADPEKGRGGKLLRPERRRCCVDRVQRGAGVWERRAEAFCPRAVDPASCPYVRVAIVLGRPRSVLIRQAAGEGASCGRLRPTARW